MSDDEKYREPEFSKRGAWLGFIAYFVVVLILLIIFFGLK